MTIEDLCAAVAEERWRAAVETRARCERFLTAVDAGKLPRDPADIPRALQLFAESRRIADNPKIGWTFHLDLDAHEVRLEIGEA